MSAPMQAFRPRLTESLGVEETHGWSLKWYAINVEAEPMDEEIVEAAKQVVASASSVAEADPAVGFAIVHRGEEAVWLLPAFWRGDMLYQRTFRAPLSDPTRFEEIEGPDAPTACVWELVVHAHERDAFVAHVLSGPRGPDTAAYLSDVTRVEVREAA
jgi:hypothetical protein